MRVNSNRFAGFLFLLITELATAQSFTHQNVDHFIDSTLSAGHDMNQQTGGIIAIYKKNELEFLRGFGYSIIAENKPVNTKNTIFQIASVGKVFTAMAVMQQVEKGALDLDTDIRQYLDDHINIDPTFEEKITLRHLLTHSAGFDDRIIGYGTKSKDGIIPLGKHLAERLPKRYIEPGIEISYSNYSYALAGYIVERVSGQSFAEYVSQQILLPLKMHHSYYEASKTLPAESGVKAIGYNIMEDGSSAVENFYRHPIPAGGLSSTASDMLNFLKFFVERDSAHRLVLSDAHLLEMTKPQFSNSPLLEGYSFGFEIQNLDGIFAFSKGGSIPGFRSLMVVYPEQEAGLFIAVNQGDDTFIEGLVENFTRRYLAGNNPKPLYTPIPVAINRFVGSYRENRYSRHSVVNILALRYMNLWSNDGKIIRTYQDGVIQEYHPIDKLVFQNLNEPSRLMVFEENKNGDIIGLSRSNKLAGMMVPAKYEKLKWYDTHNVVNEASGFVLLTILFYLFGPFYWVFLYMKRRKNTIYLKSKDLPLIANISAFTFALVSLVWIIQFFFPLLRNRNELIFGMLPGITDYYFLVFLLPALLIVVIYSTVIILKNRIGWKLTRVYYMLFTVASIGWVLFLIRWNFMGYNF